MLFLLLFLYPICDASYLNNYIKQNLDRSVKPCDDFVKHTCPENMKTKFYMDFKAADIYTLLKPYLSKDSVQFLTSYDENKKTSDYSKSDYIEKLAKACEDNHGDVVNYIAYLVGLKKKDRECSQTANAIAENIFTAKFAANQKQSDLTLSHTLLTMEKAAAYNQYINDPRNNFTEINIRVHAVYENMRAILMNLVPKTPWIKEKNLVDKIQNKLRTENLTSFEYSNLPERAVDVSTAVYNNCIKNISTIGAVHLYELRACFILAGKAAVELVESEKNQTSFAQLKIINKGPDNLNAAYSAKTNTLIVYPPLLKEELTENPFAMIGSLGFFIAHEISHVLFNKENIDTDDVPQNILGKMVEFMQFLCKNQTEVKITRKEDTSDWMAMRLTKLTSDNLQEPIPNGINLLQDQLFFYYSVITMCQLHDEHQSDGKGSFDSHSPGQIRIRAAVMQHPDFAKAFYCKKGDHMVLSEDHRIDLLGSDKI